jgi:hypothetical protein
MTSPPERQPEETARLVHLFQVRSSVPGHHLFEVASDGALACARALGPALASDAVAQVLERYEPGRDHHAPERAADAAARLRLAATTPTLVACLERLSEYDPVAHAALRALESIGAPAVEPLLAAFARCESVEDRVRLGTALAQLPSGDARVCAALESILADAPEPGAGLLAAHGDRRAGRALAETLDRLELPPTGPGELRRLEQIVAVGQAILALAGRMTPAQREKFERAYARSDDLILAGYFEDEEEPTAARSHPGARGSPA